MRRFGLIAALVLTLSGGVFAQTDAIRTYRETATAGVDACQIVMNDNIATAKFGLPQPGGLKECLAEKKASIKTAFDSASKAAKAAARGPLKEHLAATFAALDSIAPLTGESAPAYEARQRTRESRLIDLWSKVEIEL